jgi:hypothetical protein
VFCGLLSNTIVFDSVVRKNGELRFVGLDRTPALADGARETCMNARFSALSTL